MIAAFFLALIASPKAAAQSYQVLYSFEQGANGSHPSSLIRANDGSFYGTANYGGSPACGGPGNGCGVVFRFARSGNDWKIEPIYTFQGGADGAGPVGIVFGPDGSLYGVTSAGGDMSPPYCGPEYGCGTVYKLTPACNSGSCTWSKTELYQFHGGTDGLAPLYLTLGPDGRIYGTTAWGGGVEGCGTTGCGIIYGLKRENGSWVEEIIRRAGLSLQEPDGYSHYLTLDSNGNIYFSGGAGAYGSGGIFELLRSDSGWTEKTLYSFQGGDNGTWPTQVLFDKWGDLLGATYWGGPRGVSDGGGTLFELSPIGNGWRFTQLYGFLGTYGTGGPSAQMTIDSAGNLYGMTAYDGVYEFGNVFKLTREDDGWTYTDLHDFTGGDDGQWPEEGSLIIDADGTVYGTTLSGGKNYCWEYGCGVLFKITPRFVF